MSTLSPKLKDHPLVFSYPSLRDKQAFYKWCYGGTLVTPWVANIRNQVKINSIFGVNNHE